MKDGCNYYTAFRAINNSAAKAASEILKDAKKYAHVMRYAPESKRKELCAFINGLYELSGATGAHQSKLKQAASIANLSDSSTKKNSRASDNDITKGAADLLIRKKVGSGYAPKSKMDHERFLTDVQNKHEFDFKLKGVLKGSSGIDMLSPKYSEFYEKEIFGRIVKCGHNYSAALDKTLNTIYNTIVSDIGRDV